MKAELVAAFVRCSGAMVAIDFIRAVLFLSAEHFLVLHQLDARRYLLLRLALILAFHGLGRRVTGLAGFPLVVG